MALRASITRACTLAAALALPTLLPAQAMSGAGDDAIPVAKGAVRIRIAGLWNDWESSFTDSSGKTVKRPLLSSATRAALGADVLRRLQPAEAAVRELTGLPALTLSLGRLEAKGDVRQSSAPIVVDVGVTRRLSIGIVVPYVESRDNAQLILNRAGDGANVGANPAFATATAAAARAKNGELLRQLGQARTRLTAEIARCADIMATGCDAIRSDAAGAQRALASALAAQSQISAIYGDSLRGASALVPIETTPLGMNVNGAIAALRTTFERFGVTSLGATTLPAGATTAYGPGSIAALARDTLLGLGYERLGNTRRAGIGDVDLNASFLLFDTFGGNQRRRLTNQGRAVRSLVSVGWRFGSAGADDALDAFDVPIGDGANALLARSSTDLILNRRLWVSGTVRLVKPFADDIVAALPLRTDSTILDAFSLGRVHRTLGKRLEVELAPRLAFGDFFGISAAYLMRRVDGISLDALDPNPSSAPLLLSQSSEASTLQAASIGVSFSTLASYVRGRSRLPLEVLYTHTAPLTASGGVVPAVSTDRLELRIYTGFPRR